MMTQLDTTSATYSAARSQAPAGFLLGLYREASRPQGLDWLEDRAPGAVEETQQIAARQVAVWYMHSGLRMAPPKRTVSFDEGNVLVWIDSPTTEEDEHTTASAIGTFVLQPQDALGGIFSRLEELRNLPDNWNGYGALPPNPVTIERAGKWMEEMYRDASGISGRWLSPHVASSEEGEVVFEWSCGNKNLTVYISLNERLYIRDWGVNISHEMDDGDASTPESRRKIWSWLVD